MVISASDEILNISLSVFIINEMFLLLKIEGVPPPK
jgi:hypothetical protein